MTTDEESAFGDEEQKKQIPLPRLRDRNGRRGPSFLLVGRRPMEHSSEAAKGRQASALTPRPISQRLRVVGTLSTMCNMPQSPKAVAHAFVRAINGQDLDKLAKLMFGAHRLRTQGGMA